MTWTALCAMPPRVGWQWNDGGSLICSQGELLATRKNSERKPGHTGAMLLP